MSESLDSLYFNTLLDEPIKHTHQRTYSLTMQQIESAIFDSNDYTFLFSRCKSMSTRRAVLALYKRALRVSQSCPDSIMRRKVRFVGINQNIDVLECEGSV